LDKGIESLKTAQQQLKVYRQAVLKWAFEGKLTNKNVIEGELPAEWKWSKLKEITSVLGDGLHGTPKYSGSGEYYFINGNNLSDGKIEIKENTKRVSINEYEKYKKPLNESTIFVSINGTLGNTAFYNAERVILGKRAGYSKLLKTIDKQYVRYCITSQRFINYAHKNATGSTIKNVGLKAMREFEIPLPPTLEEQHAIVAEIESRLSVCDKIEESIEQSLKQSESLRQSILKKAFEGKLVPQDPSDEPASKLLERIKAQKEKTESKRE
jgi:type I restriction enzyme S subunit